MQVPVQMRMRMQVPDGQIIPAPYCLLLAACCLLLPACVVCLLLDRDRE